MPKGQTPKMHGSTVPVHVSETCNQLQREGACEEFILVKFKKNYLLTHYKPVLLIYTH